MPGKLAATSNLRELTKIDYMFRVSMTSGNFISSQLRLEALAVRSIRGAARIDVTRVMYEHRCVTSVVCVDLSDGEQLAVGGLDLDAAVQLVGTLPDAVGRVPVRVVLGGGDPPAAGERGAVRALLTRSADRLALNSRGITTTLPSRAYTRPWEPTRIPELEERCDYPTDLASSPTMQATTSTRSGDSHTFTT